MDVIESVTKSGFCQRFNKSEYISRAGTADGCYSVQFFFFRTPNQIAAGRKNFDNKAMVGFCFGCGIKSADAETDFHRSIRHGAANAVVTDHCLKVFDSNAGRNRNYECVFDPFFAGFDGFSKLLLNAYYDHSAEVDDEIRAHLRNWTMERLPRVSLTVLRLAIAEMLFGGENKPGVAINEAVELTKKYGADEDYQFVNGLLGAVARDHGLNEEAAVEPAEQ